jgi:hypothetical protein
MYFVPSVTKFVTKQFIFKVLKFLFTKIVFMTTNQGFYTSFFWQNLIIFLVILNIGPKWYNQNILVI